MQANCSDQGKKVLPPPVGKCSSVEAIISAVVLLAAG